MALLCLLYLYVDIQQIQKQTIRNKISWVGQSTENLKQIIENRKRKRKKEKQKIENKKSKEKKWQVPLLFFVLPATETIKQKIENRNRKKKRKKTKKNLKNKEKNGRWTPSSSCSQQPLLPHVHSCCQCPPDQMLLVCILHDIEYIVYCLLLNTLWYISWNYYIYNILNIFWKDSFPTWSSRITLILFTILVSVWDR